ncbi:MAG TPA: hypothetical protein VIJ51_05710 [Solirubrobacteraceae bacterium]
MRLDIDSMFWGLPAGLATPIWKINTAPLVDGSPVAWFDFHGAEPPAGFNPHPSLQVVVDEPEAAKIRHTAVGVTLDALLTWIEVHILELRFRPLFP